jgi:hypothetical protein
MDCEKALRSGMIIATLDVPACLAYDDGYYKAYDAVKLVG